MMDWMIAISTILVFFFIQYGVRPPKQGENFWVWLGAYAFILFFVCSILLAYALYMHESGSVESRACLGCVMIVVFSWSMDWLEMQRKRMAKRKQ
jgi:hypothetical protein